MRFYRIEISDPASGQIITPPGFEGLLGGATYTSFVNGQTLPGAWNVELDVPVIGSATPQGSALCRVWGISRAEIAQANDLNGKNIKIFGGMQKGLPLAKAEQSGLLVQGYIFQAFGNWIETDQTLDFVIMPGSATSSNPGGTGTIAAPRNLVLNWKANSSFSNAIKSALTTAFPGSTVTVNVDAGIVRPNDEVGFFPTLEQFSQYVRQTSLDVIKTKGYAGVTVLPSAGAVSVFDGSQSQQNTQKQIAFEDLIGQPTWIEAPNIQFKTVMRADISVGDSISLPQTVTTNSQASLSSQVNQQLAFQGGFRLVSARHVGNFRQPSADAWVSVFEGAPLQQASANG